VVNFNFVVVIFLIVIFIDMEKC